MERFELVKQGAEAKLYKGIYLGRLTIAKERFIKEYRHKSLDNFLTRERMKAEGRAIVRCKACGIRTPALYLVDFNRRVIFMEYFEHSISMKEFIESSSEDMVKQLSLEFGKILGNMHDNNIVHGDLTSSNILVVNKNSEHKFDNVDELYLVLIDFGLAHLDCSTEDKGVDLYVLERALGSTHSVADKIFPKILEGYKSCCLSGYKEIFSKFEEVRARGRKRTMVG